MTNTLDALRYSGETAGKAVLTGYARRLAVITRHIGHVGHGEGKFKTHRQRHRYESLRRAAIPRGSAHPPVEAGDPVELETNT